MNAKSSGRRPQPLRSSLSGASPVTPPKPPEPLASQTRPPKTPKTVVETKKPKYPPKVSFYQDREDTDRVRGALLHTMATEGPRTLSQFINDAVMKEVTRLEKKHNAGKPFPKLGAGMLPQGRPLSD